MWSAEEEERRRLEGGLTGLSRDAEPVVKWRRLEETGGEEWDR